MNPESDPELSAAVDAAMTDALVDLGPLLHEQAPRHPMRGHTPDPEEIVRRLRANGLPDPDDD